MKDMSWMLGKFFKDIESQVKMQVSVVKVVTELGTLTNDYRPERLTVNVDPQGIVVGYNFG